MTDDLPPHAYKYNHASGASHDDCVCAGYRWAADGPMTSELTESSVLRMRPGGTVERLLRVAGIITGVWRSDAGVTYASMLDGRILWRAQGDAGAPWAIHESGGALSFVWGLREDLVFTGGRRRGRPFMLRGDGATWSEVPCDGHAVAVHGVHEDLLVAVGYEGYIGRWTGSSFRALGSPVQAPLASVHVVDGHEMYACGPRGHVLEGSAHGWVARLRRSHPFAAIRKWNDRVWLAAADDGLMTLENDDVLAVRPDIRARSLEARRRLLIAAPDRVASTDDGEAFPGYALDGLVSALSGTRPPWEP
ncbi:MAG TPA: hypothetical protein RMH99_29335 [Sandaracinaceae bacterium LLY-WYZ-13_1]|nr:hypothetical protein [Sandaracinaceae bacterium LLY-WYZ-13_1]